MIPEERPSKKNLGILLISVIFLSSLVLLLPSGLEKFLDPEVLASVIGPYGPLGVIAGQILQVILAPIPPVTAVASGLLYGPVLGAFYSIIGASIGSVLGIFLSRRYGRPVVEKFVSESVMEKFDSYTERTGYLPFIILFVLPGFPDDALCFIAGLTKLDWKALAFIGSIGRLPGILMLTTTGHSIAEANILLFALSASAVGLISVLSVKYRKEIELWTDSKIKALG